MKKILVTGFEPFGVMKTNASWEAVKLLPKALSDTVTVETLLLPVEYDRAAEIALDKISEISPDIVLSVGVAASRRALTPEYLAINVKDSKSPDNAGKVVTSERIIDEGDSVLYTNFPYAEAVAALASTGASVEASFDAGTYVCNDLFYRVLYHIQYAEKKILGGFLHIPPESVIAPEEVARSIEALLVFLSLQE